MLDMNSVGTAGALNIGHGMHLAGGEAQNLNMNTGNLWMGMGMDGLGNYNMQGTTGLGGSQQPAMAGQNTIGSSTALQPAELMATSGQYPTQWPGNETGSGFDSEVSNTAAQGAGPGRSEPVVVLTETQLQDFVKAAVKAELERDHVVKAAVRAELAKDTYVKDKRTQTIKVPAAVKTAVHHMMLRLMGCVHKNKRSSHSGVTAYFDLPDPLPEGEPKHTVKSGNNVVTLWNPDWFRPVDEGVNVDFIAATVNAVVQSGGSTYQLKPEWLEQPALIKHTSEAYFRHLRRQYKYRNNADGLRRLAAKMKMDKRLGRRQRKTQHRMKGISALRKAFGRASTVGIEELVKTELMSSEASSEGEADPEERDCMRVEQGAGRRALERRRVVFRSEKLNRIYYALDAFARVQESSSESENIDNAPGQGNDDDKESEESELSEDERMAFRAEVLDEIRVAEAQDADQRYDRFRGPKENYRTEERRTKRRKTMYKECYSQTWVNSAVTHKEAYNRARTAPSEMTIFQLEIPDEFIMEVDRGYLGDAE
ncbi:hypothetical protein C8T65DRAFT_698489 [Cerioporus squamosus]|nr:hypothetical protein C8T65DRAFT_698489 [Cerioporus squamosus]